MNKKIKYSIKLLSDTCCGTGTGNGSDVDISASFDEAGLPIIPSMRLRGLLREQAFILEEKYGRDAIYSLFGDSGIKSRISVKTATIENAEEIKRDLMLDKSVSKKEISEVFSVKRASTAIDSKTGIAQTGSLRTISAVRSGTVLEGFVTIKDATDTDAQIIRDSFALLRNIGLNKHRGLGEISCTTDAPVSFETFSAPSSYSPDGAICKCDYTLKLQQNVALMLNSPMRSVNYIPGSALQGVIGGLFAGSSYFDKLIFDDLKIGNAFISEVSSEKRPYAFRPTPLSYVTIKNEPGKAYDLADGYERKPDKQYVAMGGYMYDDGKFISKHSVKSGTDYHINKGQNNKVQKKEFRNTVRLDKGQSFIGTIYGSRGALELVKNAIHGKTVTIGAAGASEYGECLAAVDNVVPDVKQQFKKGSRIIAELISDAVIVNALGTNSTKVNDLVDSIAGHGALSVSTDQDGRSLVFTKTDITGGYNAKWGMPKPQSSVFVKGSTFVLECLKDISVGSFVGIKNDEGYGQILIHNSDYISEHSIVELPVIHKTGVTTDKASVIIKQIESNRHRKEAELIALEAANKYHNSNLSSSAAMRMLSLYQALRAENKVTPENFKSGAEKFNKNKELQNLAKRICSDYSGTGLANEFFEAYLRSFLTRYKEISRQNKTDEKNERGGND